MSASTVAPSPPLPSYPPLASASHPPSSNPTSAGAAAGSKANSTAIAAGGKGLPDTARHVTGGNLTKSTRVRRRRR